MARYLVTDPCYVVPAENWSSFLDETAFGELYPGDEPYVIPGFGKIVESNGSEGGDGHWKLGNGKEVMTDAGLVCIVELDEGVEPTDYNGNAVTNRADVARNWFNKVVGTGEKYF